MTTPPGDRDGELVTAIAEVIAAQRRHLWDVDFCEVQALALAILEAARPHLAAGVREELRSASNPESLGVIVREVWVSWAREQDNPKPSWLTEWDDLDDGQREVDMRIGSVLAGIGAAAERGRLQPELNRIEHDAVARYEAFAATKSAAIAAGVREECARLAEQYQAIAWPFEGDQADVDVPFADLLRQGGEGGTDGNH